MPTPNRGTSTCRGDTGPSNRPGKRSRVSRACDQCRAAREKCDGQSICSTCASCNRTCSYTASPKKRGIQPGYIRTLELALTWLFINSDAESLLNRKLLQEGQASVLLQKDTTESNKLHRSWRRSKFCKDVDKLLSGADIGEGGSGSPHTDDQDSDADEPPLQPVPDLPDSPGFTGAPLHSTALRQTPFTQLITDKFTPLPPNRWQLFDLYFAYTHCWFPICEKHDILKLSYSYPECGLQLSSSMASSGEHAELWGVLALASLQQQSARSSETPGMNEGVNVNPQATYDTARALIPLEQHKFELGHVSALLLLALFNIACSYSSAAWLIVGHASRIVLSLEHNQRTSRYKHVYLGCFCLDQLLSLQLKRPPYLRDSNPMHIGKVDENGLEEWAPWVGCLNSNSASTHSRAPALTLSTYNRLIDLMRVASRADFTSTPPNIPSWLTRKLDEWEALSSTALVPGTPESNTIPSAPPALLLQAVYHCCRLLTQPTHHWAQRMIHTVNQLHGTFGGVAVPPIVGCLLEIANSAVSSWQQHDEIKIRLDRLRAMFDSTWCVQSSAESAPGYRSSTVTERDRSQQTIAPNIQVPTPDSLPVAPDPPHISRAPLRDYPPAPGHVLPGPEPPLPTGISHHINLGNPPSMQGFDINQLENHAGPPMPEQWYANTAASQNMETLFDELASLDGAERVKSQPQFMQNLGFAPDARIADLMVTDFGQLNAILGYPT